MTFLIEWIGRVLSYYAASVGGLILLAWAAAPIYALVLLLD